MPVQRTSIGADVEMLFTPYEFGGDIQLRSSGDGHRLVADIRPPEAGRQFGAVAVEEDILVDGRGVDEIDGDHGQQLPGIVFRAQDECAGSLLAWAAGRGNPPLCL